MRAVRFEYQKKRGLTPFEVFLRHSDEKEKSSVVLGRILKRLLRKTDASLLDVGAGNGEYLRLALSQVAIPDQTRLTLLEPSPSLVRQLRRVVRRFSPKLMVTVEHSTLQEFSPHGKFDVILASHLPFPEDQLAPIYSRLLGWLNAGGALIVVLRKRDDVHAFRTRFKSQLMGTRFQSLTIDDARVVLKKLARRASIRFSNFRAQAALLVPFDTQSHHTISIVEFLLNERWRNFPESVRQDVLKYIRRKQGRLHICEGFLVVKVPGHGSRSFK